MHNVFIIYESYFAKGIRQEWLNRNDLLAGKLKSLRYQCYEAVEKYTGGFIYKRKLNSRVTQGSLNFGNFFLINNMLVAEKLLELFQSIDLSIHNIFAKVNIQLNRHQLIGLSEFSLNSDCHIDNMIL